nr:hypothetical protein [Tanacetum cinerariifolium]
VGVGRGHAGLVAVGVAGRPAVEAVRVEIAPHAHEVSRFRQVEGCAVDGFGTLHAVEQHPKIEARVVQVQRSAVAEAGRAAA